MLVQFFIRRRGGEGRENSYFCFPPNLGDLEGKEGKLKYNLFYK
jgi:hypothetical protein